MYNGTAAPGIGATISKASEAVMMLVVLSFPVSEQIRFERSIKHRDEIALLNINSNL